MYYVLQNHIIYHFSVFAVIHVSCGGSDAGINPEAETTAAASTDTETLSESQESTVLSDSVAPSEPATEPVAEPVTEPEPSLQPSLLQKP